jgi:urease accessory protein
MKKASRIIGNFYSDIEFSKKYFDARTKGLCETVTLSRLESQRTRMRKTTDKGNEVAILLEGNRSLKRGDVLQTDDEKFIEVEREPEDVAVIKVRGESEDNHHKFETAVRMGHALGNLHRPIKVENDAIYVPIQAETEIELLRKLLGKVSHHVEVTKSRMVFEPDEAENHAHT